MDKFIRHDEIQEILRAWNIKGGYVAAVKQSEDGSWHELIQTFGQRNEKGQPVTENTRFFIASNSKLFCALAADMALREAGYEKGLKTRFKDVVPEYELEDPVATENATFEDALAHCTGLPRYNDFMTPDIQTLQDQLDAIRHMRPSLCFREANQYHNPHYDLIALIIEKLATCDYIDYVAEKIFQPLGMKDTSVSVDSMLLSSNHAEGYWQMFESTTSPGCAVPLPCGMSDKSAATLGSGRISSTAMDMSKWLKVLLLGGRCPETKTQILPEETVKRCMTGTVRFYEYARDYPELSPAVYGLGLVEQAYQGHTLVEHVGSLPGWMSRLMLVPEIKLGLFVTVNNAPWGEMAGEEIKYAILDNIFGLNKINWNSRFLVEKLDIMKKQEAIYKAAIQLGSDGNGITASKIAGVYSSPGFVTWKIDEAHVLPRPPEKLVDILPLPMIWGKVQPLIWHTSGNSYKMCWKVSFPDQMGYEDELGYPLDVEIDVRQDNIKGFGIRGLWGAGKGVPSLSGDTVQQRSEVYLEKVK